MSPHPPAHIAEVTLDILVLEGDLSPSETARHLRLRLGSKFDDTDAMDVLLHLQGQGRARLIHGRWEATGTPTQQAMATRERHPLHTSDIVDREEVYQSKPPAIPAKHKPTNDRAVSMDKTRWAAFRRLCAYYSDCLREDEAPSLRLYTEQERQQWLRLHHHPQWSRLETTETGGFSRPIRDDEVEFVKHGKKARTRLYLAYPCELVRPRDPEKSPFWSPLFILPLEAKWSLDRIDVRPCGPPAVNPAWFQFAFRHHEDRKIFSELVGLTVAFADEEEAEEPEDFERVPFPEMVQRAGRFLKKSCRETLDPYALSLDSHDLAKQRAGIYNVAALATSNKMTYTMGLLQDLEKVRRAPDEVLDQTALRALFPHAPPGADPEPTSPATGSGDRFPAEEPDRVLNPAQQRAVRRGRELPLTVITGPPGTGKSAVVAALMVNQAIDEQPTLFASRNHQALDAVEPRLTELAQHRDLVVRPRRAGSMYTFRWKDFLSKLLERPSVASRARHVEERQQLSRTLEQLGKTLQDVQAWHDRTARLAEIEESLDTQQASLPPSWREHEFIQSWAGPSPAGVREARDRFAKLVEVPTSWWQKLLHWFGKAERARQLESLLSTVKAWPKPTARLEMSTALISDQHDLWESAWRSWFALSECHAVSLERGEIEAEIRVSTPMGELVERQQALRGEMGGLVEGLLIRIADTTHIELDQAQRARFASITAMAENFGEARARRQLMENLELFSRLHPLWAVTNLSARSSLPLVPGQFDLVIIDEASQCDIASVVPLLFRARRAAIAGDPKQLNHVTTLSPQTELRLLSRHGIIEEELQRYSYRVNSMYDLAASAPALEGGPIFLDEHYRCHPDIAHYASETFYTRALNVRTKGQPWKTPRGYRPGLHWTDVRDEIDGSGGSGAHSDAECSAVLGELQKMEAVGFDGSVGVVTPFKRQRNRLNDLLTQELSEDLRFAWKLKVGTAHAFQGDERDVILVSLCCGPGMRPGTQSFVTRTENLFNVSVTRARAILHVVGNLQWAKEEGPTFIRKLASLCTRPQPPAQRTPRYESVWEQRLDEALHAVGIKTECQYPIAGRRLDLAVLKPKIKLDIEVDGETYHRAPDGGRKPDDLWRDHQLRAIGWSICRFWVYELREDMDGCVQKVQRILEEHDDGA